MLFENFIVKWCAKFANCRNFSLQWIITALHLSAGAVSRTICWFSVFLENFSAFDWLKISAVTRNCKTMDDDLWWRTTFDGRQPLIEDNLWWRMTFGEKRSLIEDVLLWKTTYDVGHLWWKMSFDGRWPLIENNLWWKSTIYGRQPLEEHFSGQKTKTEFNLI